MLKELMKEILKEELVTKPKVEAPLTPTRKAIVILQRGWIVVGDLEKGRVESLVLNASVIRRWGTKKGIGELALEGPQPETKLDECGTVRFNNGSEVCTIDCVSEKWN